MPRATKGVLIQADASIKAILVKIDSEQHNAFIIEDLDDETLVVKEGKLAELQQRLKDKLKDTIKEAEDSGSD
ncbi:nucleotide excision repair, TFIIH, subunit [Patellaria atrata CBS 101060]|uniref:General transcription and DNA repair factor IIH subunit TFB5 n=1 Tax=Patellaria atrata CBS 101060 TaxID=1346257 RepID=A0A9P4SCL1_9PEZI|nr:nucleotide excision repair, TFIIH, subunit [Patellaria atrata CBS 101060]